MLQPIAWIVLAAIHAVPALALFRPASLRALYGVGPESPLFLLMRHRAALFLAIFVACAMAAFQPDARRLAAVMATISMASFLLLYAQVGAPRALRRIALVDLLGLPVLAYAVLAAFGQIGA